MVVSARSVSFSSTFPLSLCPRPLCEGLEKTIGPHLTRTCRSLLILDTHITGWPFRACWTVFDDYDRLWDYDLYDVDRLCVQKQWPVTLARDERSRPLAHARTHRVPCGSARYSHAHVPSTRVQSVTIPGPCGPSLRHLRALRPTDQACARFLCYGNPTCKNAHA